jgi:hypothetical protein
MPYPPYHPYEFPMPDPDDSGNADVWGGPHGRPANPITPAPRHAPGRMHNPSAARWRRTAIIGIPVALLVGGCLGGMAGAGSQRVSEPLGTPYPSPVASQVPPEAQRASRRATRRSPEPPLPTLERRARLAELDDLGDDGSRAVRSYYATCTQARRAGVAPMRWIDDDPGYREELDPDRDGVACE